MTPVRILVVDDNEDHRFFIIRALRGASDIELDIDSVEDGALALDYVFQRGEFVGRPRPHLILLDLRMPRVSGLDVLRELKADPTLRSIPVAVLSSSDRHEDVNLSFLHGGNSYVVKPASFTAMAEQLRAVREYWTQTSVLPDPPA